MKDTRFQRWVLGVVIVAGLLRLGFLFSGEVLPVMWDARRYASAAIALISFVDTSGPEPATNARQDRYAFKYYYNKYIQGEKIDWQSYAPHSLTQARDDLFFSGPLYPFMLATIFYIAPAADFTCARVLGIIFDLFSVWLIVLVAARLIGRRAAIVSGVLYAIYFPFIQTSTMLLLETSTSFFILLAVYVLMRGTETGKRQWFILVGLICGLLVMHKPTAMLLIGPLVAGFYFYTRDKSSTRQFLARVMLIALPAGVIFCSWLTVASLKYGQLALRDPTYAGANLRQSSSIEFEGYDLDTVEDGFWERQIYGGLTDRLSDYTGLFMKKFERLWGRPYNDFKRTFLLPIVAVEGMHRMIIVFGFFGLFLLALRGWPRAAWPIMICSYYTAIHLVFHSINRYAFNAMPMLIMGAASFSMLTADGIFDSASRRRAPIVVSLSLLMAACLLTPTVVDWLADTGLAYWAVMVVLCLKLGLWMVASGLLIRTITKAAEVWKQISFVLVGGLIFMVMTWIPTLSRDAWAEFECRLDDPSIKAGSRLYISSMEEVGEEDALGVFVDLNSPSGRQNSFTLSIGDMRQDYVGGKPPLSRGFYPKPTYVLYAQLESMGIEAFRQYAMILVEHSDIAFFLEEFGYLDISVAINNRLQETDNYVTLYGSRITRADSVFIPTVGHTAIERYVHRGDPRIREAVKFMSDSSISYYIRRDETDISNSRDLSPAVGRQTGRYNIFLLHIKPDGELLVY